jgi:hypothetical protein
MILPILCGSGMKKRQALINTTMNQRDLHEMWEIARWLLPLASEGALPFIFYSRPGI